MKPLVSVMCLTYNHEPYLRQALDSILMQKTDFPFEVLIGEDCSPDNSREILKEYESKHPDFFQMFYREKNIGGTKNYYDLVMRTKGKYLIALETDDYWTDPFKLQKQVDFLEQHPEYIGIAHDSIMVNERDEVIQASLLPQTQKAVTQFPLNDFLTKGFTFQTASLMYRNFYQDGGDYSVLYRSHLLVSDLTVLSILLTRGDIAVSSECMSAYRRVIKADGTSAASIAARNIAASLIGSMRQLVILDEYFDQKIDYSSKKLTLAERYITGVLRKEANFTLQDMKYIWGNINAKVRFQVLQYVLGFPVRKVNKLWQKLMRKDYVNGSYPQK